MSPAWTRAAVSLLLAAPALAQGPVFVDVAARKGLAAGSAHRNVFVDLDGDGWVDIVVDRERCYRNVADPAGGRRFALLPGGPLGDGTKADLLLFADVDEDGDQDALVGWSLDPTKKGPAGERWHDPGRRSHVRLLEHARVADDGACATPAVVSSTSHASSALPPEALIAAAWLDFDRDGRLDLAVAGNYADGGGPLEAFPLRLFRGLGQGAFEEVTDKAGLTQRREAGHLDSRRPLYGLTSADVDGDGWTDLLGCAYGRQRNLLLLNSREGTFTDHGVASGFAGDDDTSGVYPEATKRMFRQRGQERQDEQPFRSNGNTFDVAVGDVDNDGDWDLLAAEITHAWAGPSSDPSALLENIAGEKAAPGQPPRYRRHPDALARPREAGSWNQGDLYCAMFDADCDGRLDLLLASGDYPDEQRLRLFLNRGGLRFEHVTRAVGLDLVNAAMPSLADYDRDGDVDILCGSTHVRLSPELQAKVGPVRPFLWENRLAGANHGLLVRLEGAGGGVGSHRQAIGAVVTVEAGPLRLRRQLQGGHGHAGHSGPHELHFGLGPHAKVDRLVVHWPGPRPAVTELRDLAADRGWLVREADGAAVELGPH